MAETTTTRVLLRVKRRRAASATAAARIDDDDDDDDGPPTSRTRTNDNDHDEYYVPDRIRFVLPRDIRGNNVAPAEANSTSIRGGKRGRVEGDDGEDHQREITELMRGLVSAAVVRRNNGEDTTNAAADPRLAPLDDDELALLRQQSNGDEKLTLGGSPWRVGKSSLRGKSREFGKGDEKTTPERQTMTGGDDDDDDDEMVILPPPPTKTKRHRTIAFRRMKPGVITRKEGEGGSSSPRWVRVVDVTLDEDTSYYDDGNDGLVKKLDAKMIDIGGETTVQPICRGRRRTRPNDDTAKGDDREERNNNKRRKLGLTVVGSRTVLESDFLREEGQQRQQRQQLHQSTVPIVSTTTTATEEDNYDVSANEPGGIVERRDDDTLDSEVVRLIEWSLIALHNQGGGSIMPHLAFLKDDPRLLAYRRMNTGMCSMIDVALVNGVNMPGNDSACGGKGRTVLHIAAMWGDVGGVKESMAMGASVTAVDARGDTPSDLAKRAGHDDVVTALMEGGKRERKTVNGNCNGDDGARISDGTGNGVEEVEYYYEMYCRDSRFRHPEMLGDDMPDLERSSVMSWEEEEEEDDDVDNLDGDANNWTSIEKLQKGFGFLNERGELVLEAGNDFNKEDDDDEEFLRLIYNNGDVDDDDGKGDDIEHDSNDEGYDGNDYPDDEENDDSNECDDDHRDADSWSYAGKSSRCSSEDDDDLTWKLDFRNRFVSQDMLDYGYEYEGINDGIDLLDDE